MNSKEFANGLYKLAEQHKNDQRTIFDTDWPTICTEAANYILELQRQLDDIMVSNEAWVAWYEKERLKEKENKQREIEPMPTNTIFPEEALDPIEKDLDVPEFVGYRPSGRMEEDNLITPTGRSAMQDF